VKAIKTVPYAPLSHPCVERLIGTIRRECLDRTLFWTAADLEVKFLDFQHYFNGYRAHAALGGLTPKPRTGEGSARASVSGYRWRAHCRGQSHADCGITVRDVGSSQAPELCEMTTD
jgi:putative transposase